MKKGNTLIEIYGAEKADQIKEKQRNAKLGKKGFQKGFKKEEHWKWIKDRAKVIGRHQRNFHDPEYKQWRQGVLLRDNFKCRLQDEHCSKKIISHHILTWREYPEKRYDINNGIILCHFHHPRRREDEKRLAPILLALLANSS